MLWMCLNSLWIFNKLYKKEFIPTLILQIKLIRFMLIVFIIVEGH